MEGLLTPLKTTLISDPAQNEENLVPIVSRLAETTSLENSTLSTPEDALEALKSKPNFTLLNRVLRWLDPAKVKTNDFNIKIPGPKATQIIYVLVADTVLDYWGVLNEENSPSLKQKSLLLRCLRSVSGIGAILARLRVFLDLEEDPQKGQAFSANGKAKVVRDLLSVLEDILKGSGFVSCIQIDIDSLILGTLQRTLLWKDFIITIASGRLLSLAAEADQVIRKSSLIVRDGSWLGDGIQYSSWLGANVAYILLHSEIERPEDWKALAQLVNRALTLGYIDHFVQATCSSLIHGKDELLAPSASLIQSLGNREQKVFLYSLLRILSKRNFSGFRDGTKVENHLENSKALSGVAALISNLVKHSSVLEDALESWLVGVSGLGIGEDIAIHRAVIAVLSVDFARMLRVFNKILQSFGDKLSIKHTPILQQEVNTQVLLLLSGYIYRRDTEKLSQISRSSLYLSGISNRLSSSSPRASLLGMIFATAISELVDPRDKGLNFSTEEINSAEGQWYKNLTKLTASIGSISDLKSVHAPKKAISLSSRNKATIGKASKSSIRATSASRVISIEELNSESESEDEGLPMYKKPDSDPEDSDEDATLVRRDKPVAPVYIRDLIAGLRDTENFDKHQLAIATASSLIRRKANFGTEVTEHIEELASLLVGLTDKYEMAKFQEMRLQGMIAILIVQPLQMGQWFSRTFFNGDYSIGQRASILTTLGLGARELAGFQKDDAALIGLDSLPDISFPSKMLPEKLHKAFAPEDSSPFFSPLHKISQSLENAILQPMALSAADKISGPNALKIRTFSSRMAVEKKRQKPIPNALAKVVADGFFLPLTARWRIHLQTYGIRTPHTSPFLLSLLLKTLSLLLHASGPTTLPLPLLTTDFWALLLCLCPSAFSQDPQVQEAILVGFLTILDVNATKHRRLAEENATQLLETKAWVEAVWERGGRGEGGRMGVLCAAVLGGVGEVVGEWERLLVGERAGWL